MNRILLIICWSLMLLPAFDDFTLSILREDGVVIPFAEYHSGIWSAPWPKPAGFSEDASNTLTDLPEAWFEKNRARLMIWYYWPSTEKPVPLFSSRVVKVENHCQDTWGLVTDLPGKPRKANETHRNIAIALNVETPVERPLVVTHSSTAWHKVLSFIQSVFDRAEDSRISEVDASSHLEPFPSKTDRVGVALSLTHLYKISINMPGGRLFYFEAKKEYSKQGSQNDSRCKNISFLKGWILQDERGDLRLLEEQLFLTDCDMKTTERTNPLGALHVDNRTYIVVVDHGWEDESYSILEISNDKMARKLKVHGGAC